MTEETLATSFDIEKKYEHLRKAVQNIQVSLDKAKELLLKLEQDDKKETFKNIPGLEGVFDGLSLVAEDGTTYEVPANYAAKSRLVAGDRLKKILEDGKEIYKQIQKAERKKLEGVLSKKEGKWYVLTESGSYKISDTAAEFNKAELNDKAFVIIPANDPNAKYAALDRIPSREVRDGKETKDFKVILAPKSQAPIVQEAVSKPAQKTPQLAPKPTPAPKVELPKSKEFVVDITALKAPVSKPRIVLPPTPKPVAPVAPKPVAPIAPKPVAPVAPTQSFDDDDLR